MVYGEHELTIRNIIIAPDHYEKLTRKHASRNTRRNDFHYKWGGYNTILSNLFAMPSLTDARASNSTFSPPYTPIAVFVGGTSGIGEAMTKALTSYLDGNIHLFIVGHNQAAA